MVNVVIPIVGKGAAFGVPIFLRGVYGIRHDLQFVGAGKIRVSQVVNGGVILFLAH